MSDEVQDSLGASAEECRCAVVRIARTLGLLEEGAPESHKRNRALLPQLEDRVAQLARLGDANPAVHQRVGAAADRTDENGLSDNISEEKHISAERPTTSLLLSPSSDIVPASLFAHSPCKFVARFPSHIGFSQGAVFCTSRGTRMYVVGYIRSRPLYNVLAAPYVEFVEATRQRSAISRQAFAFYEAGFVSRVLDLDDSGIRAANIRKFGASMQIYQRHADTVYLLPDGKGTIEVKLHNVLPSGSQRIVVKQTAPPGGVWRLTSQFWNILSKKGD